MLVLILSVYVLMCAAPVTHPLSHASSQDGARVWYSAHFCYVHTVHRGETCLASIRQVCVLHVPQWEVSVSICKSYLWQLHLLTGETAWQNSAEAGIHLAPQALCLTLYTSQDALNSSPWKNCLAWSSTESLFCLLTGVLSECRLSSRVCFQVRERKGCARIPFRRVNVWNSLSLCFHKPFLGQSRWCKYIFRSVKITFLLLQQRQLAIFLCSLALPMLNNTQKSESWAEDSFHNRQTCCRSSRWQVLRIKGYETKSAGHLHHRARASSENQYSLLMWPGNWTTNTPFTMDELGEIVLVFLSVGVAMNELIMGSGVWLKG